MVGLDRAFAEAERLGAKKKAIIFTESRKTQDYLLRLLKETPYGDATILFNGTNTDPLSKKIYADWARKNAGTDRVTGSRTADMRSALVDCFEHSASIMIATEAGAEGINLQFCSLVVNYDLPWNPQRIEQRIGRCHRYGQKHDVVVVNFLNESNEADQRVFELLAQKFQLFEGVFGASDEVLGAIESGVDFEKRIAGIYQDCRTTAEIRESFANLQNDLSSQIDEKLTQTRRQLLENFDVEVHQKLKLAKSESEGWQGHYELALMRLTRHELAAHASFAESGDAFDLPANPFPELAVAPGRYELPRRTGDAHVYRLAHPLAERLVERAKARDLPPAELVLDWATTKPPVSALLLYRGCSGELLVDKLSIASMDQAEDFLLAAAVAADGRLLPADIASKFFSLNSLEVRPLEPFDPDARLVDELAKQRAAEQQRIDERNGRLFEEESTKLDGWAEDLKTGLEREIKELDRQLKEARRIAAAGLTLKDKLDGQVRVKKIESERNEKRKKLFVAQDEVEQRRDELIAKVQGKLEQTVTTERILSVRWRLV